MFKTQVLSIKIKILILPIKMKGCSTLTLGFLCYTQFFRKYVLIEAAESVRNP